MLSINHSLSAQVRNQLAQNQSRLNDAIERLSSGQRINSASDDAAGQAIGNRMTASIRGQAQASRNANDGISMAQTAEGALSEINDRLQRIRELTVRGINDTMSRADQDAVQSEINMNLMAINQISEETVFNGTHLLDGSHGSLGIQVGADDGQTIDIGLGEDGFDIEALGLKDFTIAGLDDSAELRNTVSGTAYAIPVVDASTTLRFSQGGLDNPTLVRSDTPGYSGRYVRSGSGETARYYEAGVNAHHDTDSRSNTVTVNVGNEMYRAVDSVGGVAVTDSNVTFQSADGDDMSDARLVATGGRYFIAQGSGDNVRYFAANVASNSDDQTITARARNTESIGLPSFSDVETVNGNSTVTLDPKNVRVAYTNAEGQRIDNALSKDEDGNYFLKAQPGSGGDTQGNRYATVVESENNGTLLKVRSGNGDLVTYYEMRSTATTDVPNDLSTVELREVGDDFRFRHPDNPLAALDRAISIVDTQRSSLGAAQNRLATVIDGHDTGIRNLSAARSRITDADYATEVSNMSKAQILQQAGTSVLAQANQSTQGVLSLLR